jgi:predicted transposase/invertase (TIGR01784 family)
MDAYDDSLKIYRDLKNSIDAAEEEGVAKGLAEGLEKGEAIGLEKKSIEIARNSLRVGLPVETISQITGLSPEEIEALK